MFDVEKILEGLVVIGVALVATGVFEVTAPELRVAELFFKLCFFSFIALRFLNSCIVWPLLPQNLHQVLYKTYPYFPYQGEKEPCFSVFGNQH